MPNSFARMSYAPRRRAAPRNERRLRYRDRHRYWQDLRHHGVDPAYPGKGGAVAAIKPVVSGFDPGAWHGSDPAVLLARARAPGRLAEVERISPWRFKAPLSPDMAGRREGRTITFREVVEFCRVQ